MSVSIVESYEDACCVRKVKPNRQVLSFLSSSEQLQSSPLILDLQDNYLGDLGLLCLVQVLPRIAHLRFLSMANNGISNFGVQCLCGALDRAELSQLQVLDLRRNPRVTRVGGQALLNTCGRKASLAHIALEGTRVTEYFESRIKARTRGRNVDDDLLLRLNQSATSAQNHSFPATLWPRESSRFSNRLLYNAAHDEKATPVTLEASPSPDAATAAAAAAAESTVHLGDDVVVTSMPRRQRLVFGYATPPTREEQFSVDKLFDFIEAFSAKVIELPTAFMFPGRMEYMPVVHAPHDFLAPPPPSIVAAADHQEVPATRPDGADEAGTAPSTAAAPGSSSSGMFSNFFKIAANATSSSSSSAPRHHHHGSAASSMLHLSRVPDTVMANPTALSKRHLTFTNHETLNQQPLAALLDDPRWVPSQPTRGEQVQEYCAKAKLTYNVVSRDRMPSKATFREYYLHKVVDHSRTDRITSGCLNGQGNRLAVCSYDMACKVLDSDNGRRLFSLEGHDGHISDCAWNSPIGDRIVTASFDHTVRVWDAATGKSLHVLRGHDLEVVIITISADGRRVASGGMDDVAIVWDIYTGAKLLTLAGHTAEVVTIDFSVAGDMIVTGSMDETVRLWKSADGSLVHSLAGHSAEVSHVRFNKYGNIILSGSVDATCRLWDVETGKFKVLRGHTKEVVDCCFSPSGWICASASEDGTIRTWDVLTGGCLNMMVGHRAGVCQVTFSASGLELFSGSVDSTAKVWDVESGTCKQTLVGHKGVTLVSSNTNSDRLATLSRDNTCRIWKLEPDVNSLLRQAAIAICRHPNIYSEVIEQKAVPEHMEELLIRTHRKLFQSGRDSVRTATPMVFDTPVFEVDDNE